MYNYSTLDPLQVEFVEIAPVAELPEGERLFIEAAGRSIVIFTWPEILRHRRCLLAR